MTSRNDLMARAERVYVTTQGDEIRYRRLLSGDVADIPDAWPCYNIAIYYALKNGGKPKEEHAPWIDQFEKAMDRFDERHRNRIELVIRAAIEPKIVDPEKTGTPADAVPYYVLDTFNLNRFANDIMIHMSGLEPSAQEDEARRIARFRNGASVSDGDDSGEAGGKDAGGGIGDHGSVDGESVDAGGGVLGDERKDDRAETRDAEAGG